MSDENNNKEKPEIDPEILAFKEEFKKKNHSEHKEHIKLNLNKNMITRFLPFLLTIIGFAISIYIVILIADIYIVPGIVHDRAIVSVPNLNGLSLDEAEKELKSVGLKYEVSSEQYSDNLPPKTILKQLPVPNTNVKEGRPIYLTISKGKETVRVPSLIGFDLRKAKLEIMKLGLKIGELQFEFSEEYPKDTIISQSINPGNEVEYGTMINLTLSKGSEETLIMPVLIGQNLEDIMFILENYGLRLGNVEYEKSETYQSNVVIDQTPKEYEVIQLGTYVNITISQ